MQIYDFIKFFLHAPQFFFYFMLKYQSSELKAEKFALMERFWESNFSSCSITSSITIFFATPSIFFCNCVHSIATFALYFMSSYPLCAFKILKQLYKCHAIISSFTKELSVEYFYEHGLMRLTRCEI